VGQGQSAEQVMSRPCERLCALNARQHRHRCHALLLRQHQSQTPRKAGRAGCEDLQAGHTWEKRKVFVDDSFGCAVTSVILPVDTWRGSRAGGLNETVRRMRGITVELAAQHARLLMRSRQHECQQNRSASYAWPVQSPTLPTSGWDQVMLSTCIWQSLLHASPTVLRSPIW